MPCKQRRYDPCRLYSCHSKCHCSHLHSQTDHCCYLCSNTSHHNEQPGSLYAGVGYMAQNEDLYIQVSHIICYHLHMEHMLVEFEKCADNFQTGSLYCSVKSNSPLEQILQVIHIYPRIDYQGSDTYPQGKGKFCHMMCHLACRHLEGTCQTYQCSTLEGHNYH